MNVRKYLIDGHKTLQPGVRSKMAIMLLLILFATTGCFLAKLRQQDRDYLASTVLVGQISANFSGKGPIIVAAYTKNAKNEDQREVAHYTVLHDLGEYELMVAKGDYYVFAYWDKNSNLVYDAGEPAGQYGDPTIVHTPAGGVVGGLNFSLSEEPQDIDTPNGFEISPVKPDKLYSRMAGAILDLDDELFAEENGVKGYWEGLSFFKEIGGNIYFLEEFDPKKIPILFIHGATGTPKGWKFFVDNLDRTRFQPWFFYYPSGARIEGMSYLLLWKLENLKSRYNFEQLYITAHSLGGLVARSFIVHHSAQFPYVKLLVSLATPWGGDEMAEYGVQQSPAVIPCWIDMQPKSPFMESLYRSKMPETLSFYMFFGHKGNRNPFRSNNDNTIAFSSLLDHRAQAEAKMNYAFNEDHASIIYSQAVVDQYNAIINSLSQPSGGYIRIHFSYDHHFSGKRPEPTLILQSNDAKQMEMEVELSAKDTGRLLGPFPAGDYLASFGALTARGSGYVPVIIKDNETSELQFPALTPDNIISGTLISASQSKDWGAGMPYEENFKIQSIRLEGTGVHRELPLLAGEEVNISDYRIRRADCYYKGNFCFFGLPAGEYRLIIRAEGHKPFMKRCSIKTGKSFDPLLIELTAE